MRAIQLYAGGIADAVLEGRESAPVLAVGEDEFVELDEQGNPKPRAARGRGAPKKETPVRARRGGAAAPAVRRKPQPSVAAPAEGEDEAGEIAVDVPGGDAVPTTSASAPRRRTNAGAGAPRRRG
jgi:small subunit ribosomal protein S2